MFQFLNEVFSSSLCLSPISLKADYQAVASLRRFGFASEVIRRGWATSRLMEGFGRLILSKDRFVTEYLRYWEGRSSSFLHSLLHALVSFLGEGWELGNGSTMWLHMILARSCEERKEN